MTGSTGVSEQRQSGRQVEAVAAGAQPMQCLRMADVRWLLPHPLQQAAPQLGLPQQVVVELVAGAIGVTPLAPVGDQAGPLDGVRRKEPGEPPRHRVATAPAQDALVTVHAEAEVRRQRCAPGLPHRVVDHLEQRPDHAVGVPGVVALLAEQHGHQGVRAEEPDTGADPVASAAADTEPVREPLREPALHAARRHHHDLFGERVVERRRQQVTQAVRQEVGALGAMDPQGHAQQDVTIHRQGS